MKSGRRRLWGAAERGFAAGTRIRLLPTIVKGILAGARNSLEKHVFCLGFGDHFKDISPTELEKLGAAWRQNYGGTSNAGKVAMLPKGLHFNGIQESNRDMQFTEGKSIVRDEILANYGMGMEILGKTEGQSRANAEASIFVFNKYGVQPYLKLFVDTLNSDYLPAFPGTDNLEFVYDDIVPENMEEKRANADSLFNGGALTPNERRKMFGLERFDLPGMDVPCRSKSKTCLWSLSTSFRRMIS